MRLRCILLPAVLSGALFAQSSQPAPGGGEAVNHASPGQKVDLKSVLTPGRTNIVDFFSKYCPPCMRISPKLEELGKTRNDLRIVKLDINRPDIKGIDWGSPLAQQYGLQSIPHFKIFDPKGNLLKEGDPAFDQVLTWLKEKNLLN
jgi:thiol-disulfide isomerase/thioredoxin